MPAPKRSPLPACLFLAACFLLAPAASNAAGAGDAPGVTLENANALSSEHRFDEAIAMYEKLLAEAPESSELNYRYALALHMKAVVLDDAGMAQELRKRSRERALKARQYGCDDVLNDNLITSVTEEGNLVNTAPMDPDKAADEALQKAEKAFAKGDMDEALRCYQAALVINPGNYLAALYSGDVHFNRKDYDRAIEWFSKAAALDPDRETAHRYWADALMHQGKPDAAREKYIDAMIAEPYSRLAGAGLANYANSEGIRIRRQSVRLPEVKVSVEKGAVNIPVDPREGPLALAYALARASVANEALGKDASAAAYHHSLAEELAGLKALLEAAGEQKEEGDKGGNKAVRSGPDARTVQALKAIEADGLLEPFIFLERADEGIAQDYAAYRDQNRDRIRRYIRKYMLGMEAP